MEESNLPEQKVWVLVGRYSDGSNHNVLLVTQEQRVIDALNIVLESEYCDSSNFVWVEKDLLTLSND